MSKRVALADLLFQTRDQFAMMYDVLVLLNENVASASAIASSTRLLPSSVQQLISFMLAQGFARTAGSDSEFKITTLGTAFLRDFYGMRKFLS